MWMRAHHDTADDQEVGVLRVSFAWNLSEVAPMTFVGGVHDTRAKAAVH
jgi:hypothetical protein